MAALLGGTRGIYRRPFAFSGAAGTPTPHGMSVPVIAHDLPGAGPVATAPARPLRAAPPQPRSRWGPVAVAAVLVLGLGFSPLVGVGSWTVRAAALIVVAALAPSLLGAMRTGPLRLAASAATALLAVASLSAALSPDPVAAITGRYAQGTGLVFVIGIAGAWALGAAAANRADRVSTALLAVAVVNGLIGVLQATGLVTIPGTGLVDGRAPGLLGNPVQLAALLTGGLALAVGGARRRPAAAVAVAFSMAFALQATGSRYALVAAVVVVAAGVVRHRWALGAVLAAAVVAGSAAGIVALSGTELGTGSATGLERLAESGSGVSVRLEHWEAAVSAVAERPFFGHGPGRFLAAVTPHRSESLARLMPPEQRFTDAHNLAVEYAVGTGLLGLAALAIWLFLAMRGASGPLLWFAAAVLGAHLVQPQMVGTTALAFLALGAAGTAWPRPRPRHPLLAGTILSVTVVLACGAAAALVAGDYNLEQARLDFTSADARRADDLLPHWPETADVAARIDLLHGLHDEAAAMRGIGWLAEAAARDPYDPTRWNRLGEALVTRHDLMGARFAFDRALDTDPYSVRAMLGQAAVDLALEDPAAAATWTERAAALHDIAPVADMRLRIEGSAAA
jgi:O-antigen ligase